MTTHYDGRRILMLTTLLLGLAASAVSSQGVGAAEIVGRIRDTDGRLLRDIVLRVESIDACTQPAMDTRRRDCVRWTARTAYYGTFDLGPLPAGRYRVRIELGDFKPYEQEVLIEGRNVFLDITLALRSEEQIVVQVPAPALLQTRDLSLGLLEASFSRTDIESLPLTNGPTLQTFQSLVPGITFTESTGTLAQFTALGQRRFANRLTIDGMSADLAVDVRNLNVGEAGSGALPVTDVAGGSQAIVSLEAVDEIQVRTTNVAPAQARSSGALTAVITRSGTERVAGALFSTIRPDALAARSPFERTSRGPERRSGLWNGGASIGGPLVSRRATFFATWEQQATDRSVETTISVPSRAIRDAASPALRPFLDAFPQPNRPDVDTDLAEYSGEFPAKTRLWAMSVRLDATFSDRHRVFGRLHRARSHGDQLTGQEQMPFLAQVRRESTSTTSGTWGVLSQLRSRVTNDGRMNVTTHRGGIDSLPPAHAGAGALPIDAVGPTDPNATWALLTVFPGPNGAVSGGHLNGNRHRQIQVLDSVAIATDRHDIRFGAEYVHRTTAADPVGYRYSYIFGGLSPFLAAQPRLLTIQKVLPWSASRQSWAVFVQDRMTASPTTTLEYGVRYNAWRAPSSGTVDPLLLDFEALPTAQLRSSRFRLWDTAHALSPRVQLAARHGASQLRVGLSRVVDELTSPGLVAFGDGAPFLTSQVFSFPKFPVDRSLLAVTVPPLLSDGDRSQYYAFPRRMRPSHSYQWHLSLDRELSTSHRAGLAYVGAVGRDLVRSYVVYPTNAAFVLPVRVYVNDAKASYHAMLAEYVGRPSSRVHVRANYGWSHAIDTDSGESIGAMPPPSLAPLRGERGSSDFDRRHVARLAMSYRVASPTRLNPTVRLLTSDWQFDALVTYVGGSPFSVASPRGFGSEFYTLRPDVSPTASQWQSDASIPGGRRLNKAAFATPTEARQGTLGRNTLRTSPLRQIDVTISRTMKLGSQVTTNLRLSLYNVLDFANIGMPVTEPHDTRFGTSTGTYAEGLGGGSLSYGGLSPLLQQGGPRTCGIQVRLSF